MDLIFATHNNHKFKEVATQLPTHINLLSLSDLNFNEEIPEPFNTLEENATTKAETIYNRFSKACFSDDTGLFVPSLDGAPGVYSARYAGPQATAIQNIEKLLDALKEKEDRAAFFKTVVVLKTAAAQYIFEGVVQGHIARKLQGQGGFGYDPIFIPEGYNESFAQLDRSIKHSIGHRGKAMAALLKHLEKL